MALQSASKTLNGRQDVAQGRDAENASSKSDIFVLKSRTIILCLAYHNAMRHMSSWTWKQCCSKACRQLNELDVCRQRNLEAFKIGIWSFASAEHSFTRILLQDVANALFHFSS